MSAKVKVDTFFFLEFSAFVGIKEVEASYEDRILEIYFAGTVVINQRIFLVSGKQRTDKK